MGHQRSFWFGAAFTGLSAWRGCAPLNSADKKAPKAPIFVERGLSQNQDVSTLGIFLVRDSLEDLVHIGNSPLLRVFIVLGGYRFLGQFET